MRRLTALVFTALLAACSSSADSAWPDVEVLLPTGDRASSLTLRGDGTTVVSLWSIWCEPCRRELPQLQEYAITHPEVAVVALNLGDTPKAVTDYAAELGLTLPIAIDDEARVSSALGVSSVPATIVIDRKGSVVAKHLGEIGSKELAELVESGS
jgi:thiol-disulfide isomerase/thioredoxin